MPATSPYLDWIPSTPAVCSDDIQAAAIMVVHFWAVWDLHDRELDKRLSAIQADYKVRISFRSCNVDRPENRPFCDGIFNIPAIGCYIGGARFKVLIGLRSEDELRRTFDEWISAARN